MTNEIQQNRWDQLIRRVGGIIGPGSKVSETLNELFPVPDVERVPGELLFLGGTFLGFGGSSIGAAAGNFPKGMLFNPAESGMLGTVTTVYVTSTMTQPVRFGLTATELVAGIGTQIVRDTRKGFFERPTLRISEEQSVTGGPGSAIINISANLSFKLSDPNGLFVLAPNTGVQFTGGAPASDLTVVFFWRERPAELSELQF